MTRIVPALVAAVTTTAATETTNLLAEKQSIGLVTAAGIAVFVGTMTWILSSKLQSLRDELKSINMRLDYLPCQLDRKHKPKCKDDTTL